MSQGAELGSSASLQSMEEGPKAAAAASVSPAEPAHEEMVCTCLCLAWAVLL